MLPPYCWQTKPVRSIDPTGIPLFRGYLRCGDNLIHNWASPCCVHGSRKCHFKAHFPPSPVGVITSNHELMSISVVVGGNTSKCSLGTTPFGSPSLTVLETLERPRGYISAFQAPLQELSALSPAQIHTLWACSLLAIPPPPERMPPQGGFSTDLSELNLSGGPPWSKMWRQACRCCHQSGP